FATNGVNRLKIGNAAITSTVPILAPNGTLANCGISFASDPNTGLSRTSTDTLDLITGGAHALGMNTSALRPFLPIRTNNATSASAPCYSFNSDNNTGMYNVGADQLGFSTGGTLRTTINNSALSSVVPFRGNGGSNTAPTYSFNSDTNLGIYNNGPNSLGFA